MRNIKKDEPEYITHKSQQQLLENKCKNMNSKERVDVYYLLIPTVEQEEQWIKFKELLVFKQNEVASLQMQTDNLEEEEVSVNIFKDMDNFKDFT